MSHSSSTKAIFYAFSANLGIAISKSAMAFWTGSGSLLAEAVHSFADCGNQVLLFVGMKRSQKQATDLHPMGYGRETYIWSMLVAIILFSVGGLYSVYEGWQRYHLTHELENTAMALLILVIASGLEYFSLRGALAALSEERKDRSLWQWFRETTATELMVVIGEDIAALLGLLIAFVMLSLAWFTGNPAYDAVGSILIGLLLITVAVLVGREVHSLLLGEADIHIRDDVRSFLEAQTDVVRVFNLWAINHGNYVMVAVKAELKPDMPVKQAARYINQLEQQIKRQNPKIKWVFFEIDIDD